MDSADDGGPTERKSAAISDEEVSSKKLCLHSLIVIDSSAFIKNSEQLQTLSRDNTQCLVNKLFALPRHSTESPTIVDLPRRQSYVLPRKQRLPEGKVKTKWEKFAEEKGIQKRKRTRLVWDDIAKDWRPRYGYLSVSKTRDKVQNAIIEVKPGEDPLKDPFDELSNKTSLQQTKQKLRELQNVNMRKKESMLKLAAAQVTGESATEPKDKLRDAMSRVSVANRSYGRRTSRRLK